MSGERIGHCARRKEENQSQEDELRELKVGVHIPTQENNK